MKSLIIIYAFIIAVFLNSCQKSNVDIDTARESLRSTDVERMKNFLSTASKTPLDSVFYDTKKDSFSIGGVDLKFARRDLQEIFETSQARASSYSHSPPGYPDYAGYPQDWYWKFVYRKGIPPTNNYGMPPNSSVLRPGFRRFFPFVVKSPNGQYSLSAQTDGNLVITKIQTGQVLWSSKSYGRTEVFELSFQTDGNLVIYQYNNGAIPTVRWATNNLYPRPDRYTPYIKDFAMYTLQDDGNFVLYWTDYFVAWPGPGRFAQAVAETQTANRVSSHWGVIK